MCFSTRGLTVRASITLLLRVTNDNLCYSQCRRVFAVNTIDLTGIVHSDQEILGGRPVFVGTRVPVESLFDHLKAGDSIDVFLDGFPSVKRQQVVAVLEMVEQEIFARA